MKANIITIGPLGYISRFLGMASVLLGSALALMWGLAFVVIAAHLEYVGASGGPPLRLPVELPLVGLALGALGWLIAWGSRQPVACPAIAGVIANAVPLVLAVLLLVIHALI
ncbi:MAG TPA: hypothetical protein VF590_01960 [Isosphaeraceae bacterium]|jgi:hypothetical protein